MREKRQTAGCLAGVLVLLSIPVATWMVLDAALGSTNRWELYKVLSEPVRLRLAGKEVTFEW